MKRRDFLACLLGGSAAAGSPVFAQSRHHAAHHAPAAPSKLDRVAISSWSFHNYFQSTRESSVSPSTEHMALLDFPEMIADRYKVRNLEFVAPHFASVEPAYLRELKANLVRAHSRLINIPVDVPEIWHGGGLSDPDAAVREGAIQASQTWIDVAKQPPGAGSQSRRDFRSARPHFSRDHKRRACGTSRLSESSRRD